MKKVSILFLLVLIFTSINCINVFADDGVTLKIDGTTIDYDPAPFIDSKTNRTLVPLRLIAEKMDAVVDWNSEFKLVTIDLRTTTMTIKIGNNFAYVNNTEKTLEQPAKIVKDRTFVPLRFVSEALGAVVDWNEESRTINISTGKISSGTFIEPDLEVEYSQGEADPILFRILLKNSELYPDNQFQIKIQIDNYPQLNAFEQPSLEAQNKWDYATRDNWQNIYSKSNILYVIGRKYYTTRDNMKTLKITSGMKIEYTVSVKQISTGAIKDYKGVATLK